MKLLATLSFLLVQVTGLGLLLAIGALVAIAIFGVDQALAFLQFLVDNWILQAILGGWIAHRFQAASAQSERELANLEAAYQRKTDAAKGLHTLIQRRIYATRRYLAVIRAEPTKIDAERELYRVIVSEWNSEAPTHQVSLIIEFGYFEGVALDQTVFPVFAEIDRLMRAERLRVQSGKSADAAAAAQIENRLARLAIYANKLNRELIARTNRDREFLDGAIPIKHENQRYLSHFQIIKSLVKLAE